MFAISPAMVQLATIHLVRMPLKIMQTLKRPPASVVAARRWSTASSNTPLSWVILAALRAQSFGTTIDTTAVDSQPSRATVIAATSRA